MLVMSVPEGALTPSPALSAPDPDGDAFDKMAAFVEPLMEEGHHPGPLLARPGGPRLSVAKRTTSVPRLKRRRVNGTIGCYKPMADLVLARRRRHRLTPITKSRDDSTPPAPFRAIVNGYHDPCPGVEIWPDHRVLPIPRESLSYYYASGVVDGILVTRGGHFTQTFWYNRASREQVAREKFTTSLSDVEISSKPLLSFTLGRYHVDQKSRDYVDVRCSFATYEFLMELTSGTLGINHFRDTIVLDTLSRSIAYPQTTTVLPLKTALAGVDSQIFANHCLGVGGGNGIDSIIGKIWSRKFGAAGSVPSLPPHRDPEALGEKTAVSCRYRKTFVPQHFVRRPGTNASASSKLPSTRPFKTSGKGWVRVLVGTTLSKSADRSDVILGQTPAPIPIESEDGPNSQYKTRSSKRLKRLGDPNGEGPFVSQASTNFVLQPVSLVDSLDTLTTSSSPSTGHVTSTYDRAIDSVIRRLCYRQLPEAVTCCTDTSSRNSDDSKDPADLVCRHVKSEPSLTAVSPASESLKVFEQNFGGSNSTSVVPSRRTAREEIPHFEHVEENVYTYEEDKSTERSARKQAKRMVCSCTLPDSVSRDKGAAGSPDVTKDPDICARVASLVSANFPSKMARGCGTDCLNRLLMIECTNRCPCGDLCMNKQFQKRMYTQVEPFMTFDKGWGLRTLQDVEPGKFIIEYVGEVIDSKEFNKRQKHYHKDKRIHYYFMSLKQGQIIDATNRGSYSRFVNHSCDPNCETQKWTVNGRLRIGIFAKRRIPKYSELTFDYQSQRYGREPQKCYCGSFNCRGYIDKNYLPTAAIPPTPFPGSPSPSSHHSYEGNAKASATNGPTAAQMFVEDPYLADEIEDMLNQLNIPTPTTAATALVSDEDVTCHGQLPAPPIDYYAPPGMTDSKQIIKFCRLMVRTEKLSLQSRLLQILKYTKKDLLIIFINLQGLNLLWTWMTMLRNDPLNKEFKIEILDTLDVLPIQNRDTLERSKVPRIIEKWAIKPESRDDEATAHAEAGFKIATLSRNLLEKWKDMKDIFYKIPKKRDSATELEPVNPVHPKRPVSGDHAICTEETKHHPYTPDSTLHRDNTNHGHQGTRAVDEGVPHPQQFHHPRDPYVGRYPPPPNPYPPMNAPYPPYQGLNNGCKYEIDNSSIVKIFSSPNTIYNGEHLNHPGPPTADRGVKCEFQANGVEPPPPPTSPAHQPMSYRMMGHEIQSCHVNHLPPPPDQLVAECVSHTEHRPYRSNSEAEVQLPVRLHYGTEVPKDPVILSSNISNYPPKNQRHNPLSSRGSGESRRSRDKSSPHSRNYYSNRHHNHSTNHYENRHHDPKERLGNTSHPSSHTPPLKNNYSITPSSSSDGRARHLRGGKDSPPHPSGRNHSPSHHHHRSHHHNHHRSGGRRSDRRHRDHSRRRDERNRVGSPEQPYENQRRRQNHKDHSQRRSRERSSDMTLGQGHGRYASNTNNLSAPPKKNGGSRFGPFFDVKAVDLANDHPGGAFNLADKIVPSDPHPPKSNTINVVAPPPPFQVPAEQQQQSLPPDLPRKPNVHRDHIFMTSSISSHKIAPPPYQQYSLTQGQVQPPLPPSMASFMDFYPGTPLSLDATLYPPPTNFFMHPTVGYEPSLVVPPSSMHHISTLLSPPLTNPYPPRVLPPSLNNHPQNYVSNPFIQHQHQLRISDVVPSPFSSQHNEYPPVDVTATIPLPLDALKPATSSSPVSSKAKKGAPKVDLKLPKDWKMATDGASGKPYYYHKLTKQVQWEPPPSGPQVNENDLESLDSSTESSSRNSGPSVDGSIAENSDTLSDILKERQDNTAKLKEKFRQEVSAFVIQCLGPYHKKTCKVGRINSSEDFKYLARKLTHTVMAKELERNGTSVESLRLSTKMKAKTELYIEKYMEKLGPTFVRPQGAP